MSDSIKIHDKYFEPFLSEQEILERTKALGKKISNDYADKKPIFISILNGVFIFAADLIRACEMDCEVSFVKLASYDGLESTGNITEKIGLEIDLKDRHVILVEDIIDSGETLHQFLPEIKKMQPSSLHLAVLLLKPEAVQYDFNINYLGFEIPDKFVIGYGMDYDGLGRNLRGLYQLKE